MEGVEQKENQSNSIIGEDEDSENNEQVSEDFDSQENQDEDSSHSQNNQKVNRLDRKMIKKRRRTKNDQSGRDFKCGCGKTYLSYPALYTHIKEKHNSQIPEGSSKPVTNTKGNRGRPRKSDENNGSTGSESLNLSIILKCEAKDEETKPLNPFADFPKDLFIKESSFSKILNQIQVLMEAKGELTKKLMELEDKNDNGLKITICNKILAFYILDNLAHLDQIAFEELCVFCVFYRKALNESGYNAVEGLFNTWKQKPDPPFKKEVEFCECQEGFYILEVCNDLIEKNLNKYISDLLVSDISRLRLFSNPTENFKNIINLFLHFAQWLKKNQFTNSRLTLN